LVDAATTRTGSLELPAYTGCQKRTGAADHAGNDKGTGALGNGPDQTIRCTFFLLLIHKRYT
jgi:hypothetical protein